MTWDPEKYVKLSLRRVEGVRDKYLIALRTTADYYGWTDKFPTWGHRIVGYEDGMALIREPGRKGQMFCEAGVRLRICRSPEKRGYPAGFTNAFKVSRNCGLWDIAEVAHFTKGDWHWMSRPSGKRIERARWEQIYQVGISRERVGA